MGDEILEKKSEHVDNGRILKVLESRANELYNLDKATQRKVFLALDLVMDEESDSFTKEGLPKLLKF